MTPCPFCGSIRVIATATLNEVTMTKTAAVMCQNCGAHGPRVVVNEGEVGDTAAKAAAMQAWSQRRHLED